jgi:hypothetical protein
LKFSLTQSLYPWGEGKGEEAKIVRRKFSDVNM